MYELSIESTLNSEKANARKEFYLLPSGYKGLNM